MSSNYKDSISSGAAYYSNQFREDHGAKLGYDKIRQASRSVDTIETKQARLERHMLNQFHKNRASLPQNKIVLVAQAGRYLVLACILPPYFVLYEGPKWMVIQAKPMVSLLMEKGAEVIFFLTTMMVDIWSGMRDGMRVFKKPKKLITKNIENLTNTFSQMQKRLSVRMKEAFSPFKTLAHSIHNYINQFKEKWGQFSVFMKFLPLRIRSKIEQSVPKWKEKASKKIENVINKIYKISKALEPPSHATIKYVKSLFNPVVVFITKANKSIVKPLVKIANKAAVFMKRAYTDQIVPAFCYLESKFIPPLQKMAKVIQTSIIAIQKEVQRNLQVIGKGMERLYTATKNMIIPAVVPLQKVFDYSFYRIGNFGMGFRSKISLAYRVIKSFTPGFKKVIQTLWNQGKGMGQNMYFQFKKRALVIVKGLGVLAFWSLDKLKKAPSFFFAVAKRIFFWSIQVMKKMAVSIHMTLTWIKILVRHSMQQIK